MKQLLLVGLGGFIGSVARYLVSKLNFSWQMLTIPMGTLTVNIVGSLIIGIIIALSTKSNFISNDLRLLLSVGFCGGFTTFSSFSAENMSLLQHGQYATALLYISASILLGLGAVFLGYWIANHLL